MWQPLRASTPSGLEAQPIHEFLSTDAHRRHPALEKTGPLRGSVCWIGLSVRRSGSKNPQFLDPAPFLERLVFVPFLYSRSQTAS